MPKYPRSLTDAERAHWSAQQVADSPHDPLFARERKGFTESDLTRLERSYALRSSIRTARDRIEAGKESEYERVLLIELERLLGDDPSLGGIEVEFLRRKAMHTLARIDLGRGAASATFDTLDAWAVGHFLRLIGDRLGKIAHDENESRYPNQMR